MFSRISQVVPLARLAAARSSIRAAPSQLLSFSSFSSFSSLSSNACTSTTTRPTKSAGRDLNNLNNFNNFNNFNTNLNTKSNSWSSSRLSGSRWMVTKSPQTQAATVGVNSVTGAPVTQEQVKDQKRQEKALEVKRNQEAEHSVNPSKVEHARPSVDFGDDYALPHPIWNEDYVWKKVAIEHRPPADWVDTLALNTIKAIRFNFDWMSGWMFGKPTIQKAVTRVVFLESVAGLPGSIGGILRHCASLRRLERDHGWIHTLFEEAENERMHLLTYMSLKNPSTSFRWVVFFTQGIFFNFYWMAYVLSPRFCHRLVGYLEEEAVKTYTKILHEIDHGSLSEWKTKPAPRVAIKYWKLPPNATMRDVVAVTRADEAHHRDVNHAFASLKPGEDNPFRPGL